MTLGKLFAEHSSLAKISQLEWFEMPTKKTPLQFTKLGIVLIVIHVLQIRYSLVVILELNGGSEVQYKDMMIVDDGKYQ